MMNIEVAGFCFLEELTPAEAELLKNDDTITIKEVKNA